jgi:hypothetical protein
MIGGSRSSHALWTAPQNETSNISATSSRVACEIAPSATKIKSSALCSRRSATQVAKRAPIERVDGAQGFALQAHRGRRGSHGLGRFNQHHQALLPVGLKGLRQAPDCVEAETLPHQHH